MIKNILFASALYVAAVGGVYMQKFNGFPEDEKIEETIPMIKIRGLEKDAKKSAYESRRQALWAGENMKERRKGLDAYGKAYQERSYARL